MNDPCEKERKEYDQALAEELEARKKVDITLQPLGKATPNPFDPYAVNYLLEKERIKNQKFQALEDCKKIHGISR